MKVKHFIVGAFLTNCYLLISKGEVGIIDPGGRVKKVLEEIQKEKATPKYIINTHFHLDHTFANQKIKEKFKKVKILIHEAEEEFFHFKPDKLLKERDKIKIGGALLEVLHTPGHTKGSICLLGDKFIFTGDTLFEDGYGRTDLAGGSQNDLEQSLRKLKGFLKPEMIVYPGHGGIFKIEKR